MTVALMLGFGLPAATRAATISAAGSVQGEPNWDTAGYGDAGFAFLGPDDPNDGDAFTGGEVFNTNGTRSGTIRLVPLNENSNTGSNSDVDLEDPNNGSFSPGVWFDGAIGNNNLQTTASLEFGLGAPTAVRIGVLIGAAEVQDSGDTADFPDDVAVEGVSQQVDQPASDNDELTEETVRADWYFFEATGIQTAELTGDQGTDGDSLVLSASRIGDINKHQFNPINGVAISVIPEPASLSLLAPAGLLALRRRRR